MTETELKTFRNALKNRQSELLGSGSWSREALAIETSPDELDRIQEASDRDWAMSNLERDFAQVRQVRAALHRVDAGTFGVCVECGGNIAPKRLVAAPWASFCIVCQAVADRQEKTSPHEIDSLVMAA